METPLPDRLAPIRTMIWIYFWLLLTEGALRKWLFPGLSDILFLARDPVVLAAYVAALRAGVFPLRPALVFLGLLTGASLLASLGTDTPLEITVFGLRTDYLHLPFVFLMARVLDRSDVIRFGRWMLITTIPVVILMVLQFDAAPNAPINAGAGGAVDAQLVGAMGRIRPPGPFSFIGGAVAYFGLAAAFVYYGWLKGGVYSRFLVLAATAAVVCAVPISISRSLMMAVGIVVLFGLPVSLRDMRRVPAYLGPAAAAAAFLAFATDTIYIQAFVNRWQTALTTDNGGFYGAVVLRILGTFTEPFTLAAGAPAFGYGIGVGTMAGARLLTGESKFLLAESELSRIVLELGPFLGFAFIAWRLWLALSLVAEGWRTFRFERDSLAWLLAGSSFLSVLSGQWGPSTQLGFAVFGAGLCLAAANPPAAEDAAEDAPPDEAESPGIAQDGWAPSGSPPS